MELLGKATSKVKLRGKHRAIGEGASFKRAGANESTLSEFRFDPDSLFPGQRPRNRLHASASKRRRSVKNLDNNRDATGWDREVCIAFPTRPQELGFVSYTWPLLGEHLQVTALADDRVVAKRIRFGAAAVLSQKRPGKEMVNLELGVQTMNFAIET